VSYAASPTETDFYKPNAVYDTQLELSKHRNEVYTEKLMQYCLQV